MRYSLLAGGKRIRPVLTLAVDASLGASPQRVLPAAAALELIHTYSLIHDDLPAIDDDTLRRGRPTCHVAFGEDIAILAGDGLFAEAFHRAAWRVRRERRGGPRGRRRDRPRDRCAGHGRRPVHGRGRGGRRRRRPAHPARPQDRTPDRGRGRLRRRAQRRARTQPLTGRSPPRSACSSRSSTTSSTSPATKASSARASARTAPSTR